MAINHIDGLDALMVAAPTEAEELDAQRRQLLRGDFVLRITAQTEVKHVIGEVALRLKSIEPDGRQEFEDNIGSLHEHAVGLGINEEKLDSPEPPTVLSHALNTFYDVVDDHHNGLYTDLMRRSELFGNWLITNADKQPVASVPEQPETTAPPILVFGSSLQEAV